MSYSKETVSGQSLLFDLPPTNAEIKPYYERSEAQKGFAAETFTEAKLRLWGFDVFKTDKLMVYDLAIDLRGRVLKIQVKSSSSAANKLAFQFCRNSGSNFGPKKIPYQQTDYHISACVSLVHHRTFSARRRKTRLFQKGTISTSRCVI